MRQFGTPQSGRVERHQKIPGLESRVRCAALYIREQVQN
jgi:hypothetical protein